jgi:hypothetical protein
LHLDPFINKFVKNKKMKKVFALLFVAGMFTLASCESKKAAEATDSVATEVVDSAAAVVDSAATVVDSAATAVVDSVKK